LVNEDAYLLQLTRYIHRNPIEVKKKMVEQLSEYRWSSYSAYINRSEAPEWLFRGKTYQMLGHRYRYKGYFDFVEKGIDEDIKRFYGKGNILSVLGDKHFRTQREEGHDELDIDKLRLALEDKPAIDELIILITKVTKTTKTQLLARSKGKRSNFPRRAFAIYACHRYSRADHKTIANYFGLSHRGSISHLLSRIRNEIAEGLWLDAIKGIEKNLYIVK